SPTLRAIATVGRGGTREGVGPYRETVGGEEDVSTGAALARALPRERVRVRGLNPARQHAPGLDHPRTNECPPSRTTGSRRRSFRGCPTRLTGPSRNWSRE